VNKIVEKLKEDLSKCFVCRVVNSIQTHTDEVYKAPGSSAVKQSPKTLLMRIHQSGVSRESMCLKMSLEAETLQKIFSALACITFPLEVL